MAAIQLAAALGSIVFATAGSDEKCQACVELGAKRASTTGPKISQQVVKEVTAGRGVDVILDMVAGDYLPREIEWLADDGRLVIIALLGGAKGDVGLRRGLRRRLDGHGLDAAAAPGRSSRRRSRARLREVVWPLIESGRVKPMLFQHLSAGATPPTRIG